MLARSFLPPCVFVGLVVATSAAAESSLLLPLPRELGAIAATTYDLDGKSIGRSSLEIVRSEDGSYSMRIDMRVEGGGRNHVEALLEPALTATGEPALQIASESSQSTTAQGERLPRLQIDHRAGLARCIREGGRPADAPTMSLPAPDRVVNVPLQLLFRPLVEGRAERVTFQVVVCRGEPELRSLVALPQPPQRRSGRSLVEIRYGPDIGALSSLAARLLPRLSFWLDASDGHYVALRMPLYNKGPRIEIVREGIAFADLAPLE